MARDHDPVLAGAAAQRLTGLLALVRGTPGWLTTGDFVEDPVMPITSLESATHLGTAVRGMCGTVVDVDTVPIGADPAYAAALVRGPEATVLVGCRVEAHHPHRIHELVLLPSVGRPSAVPLPASAAASRTGGSDEAASRLEEWLDDARRDLNLVGVVAALYEGSRIVWSGSVGVAALDDTEGLDPMECVVRVGSITKTMLTVRSLQLVEQGVLDLHDRVGDVLTSWPISGEHAVDLEVQHLLSHTGGAREIAEERFFLPQDGPVPELADWLDRPVEIVGVPGREWAYSNVGMTLLGQVITDVTGRDFEVDVQRHVFERLGMRDTAFRLDASRQRHVMSGFAEGFEGVAPIEAVHVGARAAGSVFSTLEDVGRWAGEVVAGGRGEGALLSEAAWQDCLSSVVPVPGTGISMARGFLRVDNPDHPAGPVVWHNGALPGAAAQLWIAPRSGLSLALFTNVWSPWRTMALERRCLHLLRELASAAA